MNNYTDDLLKVEDLTIAQLLCEYDYLVKKHHYDPVDSMESDYNLSDLRQEITFRMNHRGYR